MDYGHHWAFEPTSRRYATAWPRLVADSTSILTAVAALGITTTGPDGTGIALADLYRGIALSGGPHTDALRLPAPYRNPHPSPCGTPPPVTGSCRTRLQPYDLAVAGILLGAHLLLGNDFAIRSSGSWLAEWRHGIRKGHPGARTLIADLFAAEAPASPLSWPATHTTSHQ
jgi:hypothetical protein